MDQWRPVWEIVMGTAALVTSLMIHGAGMFWIQRRNVHYQRLPPLGLRREVAFSFLILLMLATHIVEVMLWSVALYGAGAVATFRDAYYYVAVTYTTLGYGEGTLTAPWRILAPMIAMSGVFAFGWTTSVLFSIVGDGGAAASVAAMASEVAASRALAARDDRARGLDTPRR
jgi:hypothetical protein